MTAWSGGRYSACVMNNPRSKKATTAHTAPLHHAGAFVVQFRAGSDFTSGRITGRVEHVATAHMATFESLNELLMFITNTFQNVCQKEPGGDVQSI